MYPFERLDKMVVLLKKKGQVKVGQDSKLLGVSYSTFHRDLDILESQGIVEKVRGGAVIKEKIDTLSHFKIRLERQSREKEIIAKRAVDLIEDDTCIFIDHSTTCVYLARELIKKDFQNLVVLTNALSLPEELSSVKGIRVLLTGGEADHGLGVLSGKWVINAFKLINVHQIFLSVGALSPEKGFMTQIPFIYEIFSEIFFLDIPVIVLADSSKFSKVSTFNIAEIDTAKVIISDKKLPQELAQRIEKKGPMLLI